VEERLCVGDCERSARVELAAQVEKKRSDLGPAIEVGLDATQHATVLPERAGLSGATIGVTFGDQLDRAERAMAVGGHAAILPRRWLAVIRLRP